MAIVKPLVTTTVNVLHEEEPIVFADAVTDGKITRDGTNVRNQILHGDTVSGKLRGGVEVVIPYHAILFATVTVSNSDPIDKPADDFCK